MKKERQEIREDYRGKARDNMREEGTKGKGRERDKVREEGTWGKKERRSRSMMRGRREKSKVRIKREGGSRKTWPSRKKRTETTSAVHEGKGSSCEEEIRRAGEEERRKEGREGRREQGGREALACLTYKKKQVKEKKRS